MRLDTAKVANDAFGRWPGILSSLGIDPKFLRDKHGPCPMCGGKDRYRFDDQGKGSWFCSKCGAGDGFDLLKRVYGWNFQKVKEEVAAISGTVVSQPAKPDHTEESKRDFMRRLFKESFPVVEDDPVWDYLLNRCGDLVGVSLTDLRYHPALKHSVEGGKHPAMLAIMRDEAGKACGIHRTYLTIDGRKAAVDPVRMSYGECGVLRLSLPEKCLGIAEGVETAICAGKRFKVPCWAAISANGLETWEPPKETTQVLVMGDNDESFTGQAAAFNLAKRLRVEGFEVGVFFPPRMGSDFADPETEVVA